MTVCRYCAPDEPCALCLGVTAAFDPAKHPHRPGGQPTGGQWAPKEPGQTGVTDDRGVPLFGPNDRVMFHATSVANRHSIQENGLTLTAAKRYKDDPEPGVYLWDTKEQASRYWGTGERQYSDPDIWAIRVTDLPVQPDPFFAPGAPMAERAKKTFGDTPGAWVSRQSVSPSDVRMAWANPWYPYPGWVMNPGWDPDDPDSGSFWLQEDSVAAAAAPPFTPEQFTVRVQAGTRMAEAAITAELADAYARALRSVAGDSARRFTQQATALTAAADPPEEPKFVAPDPQQLVPTARLAAEIEKRTREIRQQVVAVTVGGMLTEAGIDFNVGGIFAQRILDQVGARVRDADLSTRDAIRTVLGQAQEQGWTVPQTAGAIKTHITDLSDTTATQLARTDLIGTSNASATAAAKLVFGDGAVKRWLATPDERTRETHVLANGQVVPLHSPFVVGMSLLDYPGDPAGPDGEVCNCFPETTAVEWPGLRSVARRWYEGDLVEVRFASGDVLAGTPNHPVLRSDGSWTALGDLVEGDDLVTASGVEKFSAAPDPDRPPATIGEVYRLASVQRKPERVTGGPPDFHGDGRDGEVEVVPVEGHLWIDREAASDEQVEQFGLSLAHFARTAAGSGDSSLLTADRLDLVRGSAAGVIRRSGEVASAFGGSGAHADDHRGTLVAPLDPENVEAPGDRGTADSVVAGQSENGFPGEVSLAKVVEVDRYAWCGYVLNLDTGEGWYTANGVVARNCRCTLLFETEADLLASAWEALTAAFDPSKHPHEPGGSPKGGQWAAKYQVRSVAVTKSQIAGHLVDSNGDAIGSDDYITVYHATNSDNAAALRENGFSPEGKRQQKPTVITDPRVAQMLHKEVGDTLDYEPGRGQGKGLYVSADKTQADTFGDHVVAFRVKVSDLATPPERARLTPEQALLLNDGYIEKNIPPDAVTGTLADSYSEGVETMTDTQTAAAVDFTAGSMVALYPAPHEAEALAVTDGQPADTIHLTLAFLPEGVEQPEWLVEQLAALATWFAPMHGEVGGLGMFKEGPDGVPVIALPDVVGLADLRVAVAELLAEAGVAVADNHGFQPHLTLTYGDPRSVPTETLGVPLTFEALSLVVGAERWDVPFGAAVVAAFDPALHPHRPGGNPQGGQWAPKGWGLGRDYKFKKDQVVGQPGGVPQVGPDLRTREILMGAKDTQTLYKGSGPFGYDTARVARVQNPILREDFLDAIPGQAEPETLFLAGGPGSGKSSVFDSGLTEAPPGYVYINPDSVKERLPEYDELRAAGSRHAAAATHEESSDIAKRELALAADRRYNAVMDGTGNSGTGKFLGKIDAQERLGRKVKVVMVDIPTDEAVARANKRAERTGRHVAESEIRSQHQHVAENHLAWRDRVGDWEVWSNDAGPELIARRVGGGPIEVLDPARYQQALDKAKE